MIRLQLLGNPSLEGVSDPERLLGQPKLVALLAYLAVPSPGRYVRRDMIAGVLWPELDQQRARGVLRKSLHGVRAVLGADAIVSRGDEEIALSAEHVRCDVAELGRLVDEGLLLQAVQLCAGELLPGFHLPGAWDFGEWLAAQRIAAAERGASAAWALACRLEQSSDLTDAGRWARFAARWSWSDERVLRRTMLLLDRIGDRAGAVRLYEDFVRRLRAELELDPSEETQALVRSWRSNGAGTRT